MKYNRRQQRYLDRATKGASQLKGIEIDLNDIMNALPYVDHLDNLFMDDGLVMPVPYKALIDIPDRALKIYLFYRNIYGIVTTELVEYLKNEIGDKKAIEIGCGNGTLGRALGIPITDSKSQSFDEIKKMYANFGQPTIGYPEDVEKLEAFEAIDKYKPDILIGSYITHYINPKQPEKGGYDHAPNEVEMSKLVKKYYMLGNQHTHRHNRLLTNPKVKTTNVQEPWIMTRSENTEKNALFIWERF